MLGLKIGKTCLFCYQFSLILKNYALFQTVYIIVNLMSKMEFDKFRIIQNDEEII